MAASAHESSSSARQGAWLGQKKRVGERNRGRWRQRRNMLIDNAFYGATLGGMGYRLVAEMSQEDQKRRGLG